MIVPLGVARKREDLHVAIPVDRGLFGLGFLEDAVEIGAAESERTDGPRRGWPGAATRAGLGRSSKTASCRPRARSIGWRTFEVGGSTLWYSASAALISPAAPAAALVCPTCDLTDPSAHHRAPSGRAPR